MRELWLSWQCCVSKPRIDYIWPRSQIQSVDLKSMNLTYIAQHPDEAKNSQSALSSLLSSPKARRLWMENLLLSRNFKPCFARTCIAGRHLLLSHCQSGPCYRIVNNQLGWLIVGAVARKVAGVTRQRVSLHRLRYLYLPHRLVLSCRDSTKDNSKSEKICLYCKLRKTDVYSKRNVSGALLARIVATHYA